MKKWLIEYLGGFSSIEQAINAIKKEDIINKHEILTEAVKKLFNTISSDDILKKKGGEWFYKDRTLTPIEIEMLKSEAKFFETSKLWKMMQNDIKYQLNKKMYLESNITMDIMWGKLLLYYTDIVQTRLNRLSE